VLIGHGLFLLFEDTTHCGITSTCFILSYLCCLPKKTGQIISKLPGPKKSLFYPAGTIRVLDDPIFDENIATLGMYDPASFMEATHEVVKGWL